jgi:peroxiredoxin
MVNASKSLKKTSIYIAVAIAAVLLVVLSIKLTRQSAQAPTINFTLINGKQLSLADMRGKPVLVSFWSTTCKICIRKTPEMNALYNKLHPDGFEMIAVAMPYDPPTRVVEFAKKLAMPYPVALDHEATIVQAFGNVRVTPTNFLITSDGKIAWRKLGELDVTRLGVTIQQMIENPEAAL